jgi:hypothetical protein
MRSVGIGSALIALALLAQPMAGEMYTQWATPATETVGARAGLAADGSGCRARCSRGTAIHRQRGRPGIWTPARRRCGPRPRVARAEQLPRGHRGCRASAADHRLGRLATSGGAGSCATTSTERLPRAADPVRRISSTPTPASTRTRCCAPGSTSRAAAQARAGLSRVANSVPTPALLRRGGAGDPRAASPQASRPSTQMPTRSAGSAVGLPQGQRSFRYVGGLTWRPSRTPSPAHAIVITDTNRRPTWIRRSSG